MLVPSICLDVFPTVVLDAMAYAKPVVATSFGGAREAVENGTTGYVVSPFNVEQMADHIETLLTQPELAREMGERGRALVESRFHVAQTAARYLEIMHRCAAREA